MHIFALLYSAASAEYKYDVRAPSVVFPKDVNVYPESRAQQGRERYFLDLASGTPE